MRVHHINCGTMCPFGQRLVNGEGSLFARATMVCHCLVVETNDGLALVDTGLGTADLADPNARLGRGFVRIAAPRLDPNETALAHVERLGFRRDDVRHVLPTHLDLDHAGGLSDFPDATVHVFVDEHRGATSPSTTHERFRYRQAQWAHGPKWNVLRVDGDKWFGFDGVRAVGGTDDEILLVPTVGHSRGHCAIAVRTTDGWLLHAGDAYFFHAEMHATKPYCSPGLAAFQRVAAFDDVARRRNQMRLRELARDRAGEVRVFSAHSPVELEALSSVER
jgi:glyoxylase-like metal-dependent hydrolase (beta-lactamase superfamily II)